MIDTLFSKRKLIIIASVAILLYYLPYFILGENSNILIHDNLDSNVAWIKLLIDNNAMFASPDTIIPNVMGGLPLYSIYPYYDIPLLVFNLFGVFWGYVINKLLISIIGFWGMYLLLDRHFVRNHSLRHLSVGTALIFGLLPFWSFTATVSGLPFLLLAFLNLRARTYKWTDWLIIVLFAFYSNLILSGLFIGLVLVCITIYDTLKSKKLNLAYLLGLMVLGSAYLISHFPLFTAFLTDNTVSHRVEFSKAPVNFERALHYSKNMFTKGQYHAHSLHNFLLIPIIGYAIFNFRRSTKTFKIILLFIIITSLFYGFKDHSAIKPVIDLITSKIPIQLQRFHFLHPMFWYVLLVISLIWISGKIKFGKIIVLIIIVGQLLVVIQYHEIYQNRKHPNFADFYNQSAFSQVKQAINKPLNSFKVISVGMHPAIAQYNGFYTLDGYFPSYPLTHKHQFKTVIAGELERDISFKTNFNNWGSRCYAFSAETGLNFLNKKTSEIDTLNYNYRALKTLGGEYIISSVPINTTINTKLSLKKSVQTVKNSQELFLYSVND